MEEIEVVGNNTPSGHSAGRIISVNGIAPTVMECHGTVTKIVEEIKCEQVGMLCGGKWDKMNDIGRRVYDDNGLSPTIHTMGGGNLEPKVRVKNATKKGYSEVGLYGAFDMSYPDSDTRRGRVQGNGDVTPTITATNMEIGVLEPVICALRGRNPDRPTDRTAGLPTQQMLEIKDDGTSNTLTTVQKDNLLCEPVINIFNLLFTIFDLCDKIEEGGNKYESSRCLLQILWKEIGKKKVQRSIRRLWCFQEKKILRQRMYEEGYVEDRKQQSILSFGSSNCRKYNEFVLQRQKVFDLWKEWKIRYTPQRWELSKQQFGEFNLFMQELPHERTQEEKKVQDMRQYSEVLGVLRQTLSKIQKIWGSENGEKGTFRIRKLTEKEAWRLMGFSDDDFFRAAYGKDIHTDLAKRIAFRDLKKEEWKQLWRYMRHRQVSRSQLYKQAGNSIVVNVLMEIFRRML